MAMVGATISFERGTIRLHYHGETDLCLDKKALAAKCMNEAVSSLKDEDINAECRKAEERDAGIIKSSPILSDNEKARRVSLLETPEEKKKIRNRVIYGMASKIADAMSEKRHAECMAKVKEVIDYIESQVK